MKKQIFLYLLIVSLILISTITAVIFSLDNQLMEHITKTNFYISFYISIFSLILIFFITKSFLQSYVEFIEEIRNNIKSLQKNKYEKIEFHSNSKELNFIIKEYNDLMFDFKNNSSEINNKIKGFLGFEKSNEEKNNNANFDLTDSSYNLEELSDLYNFKKQIEQDNNLEEIYQRLNQLLFKKFNINDYSLIIVNTKENTFSQKDKTKFSCFNKFKNECRDCRAIRNNNDIISNELHNTCSFFEGNKYYYCIEKNIDKENKLILHYETEIKEEYENFKFNVNKIKSFLREAKPAIEVQFLLKALKESAFTDTLTKTYNRKYLEEHLKTLLPMVERENKKLGILMLDMDHFKAVNDEYGHDIGDKVLKTLGQILLNTVRKSDIVVRFGGEEFLIILNNIQEEDINFIANKIRTRVSETVIDVYAGSTIQKTVSIGTSIYPTQANIFEKAIKLADTALYEAKSTGRNKIVNYTPKLEEKNIDLF